MTYSKEHLSATLPLPPKAHIIAEEFWENHDNFQKANEVLLNTLAVFTVHSYLQKLGIQTDLEASDSWNHSIQSCMNIADLWVTNMGRLECRPVWPEAQVCPVPIEVRENRIGYVVVQISDSLEEARILGFSQTPLSGNLRINELQSLEYLIELLTPVNLSQWLQNVFDACWHTVETLLNLESNELAVCCRSACSSTWELRVNEPDNSAAGVRRAKLIELRKQSAREQVVLVVKLIPIADSRMNVWVEVYPNKYQTHLPHALELIVLDEEGAVVGEAIARNNRNIQFKFSGEPGERFNVKVALDNVSITEAFLI
ncbi:DUF1822 family protein [Scytonema sp. UIC 10036]|uniref:DUF1822 family protein n=1 Tax=Scytonema sp. UIC 10036 TaxID=2304196 RepID=UPI0012DA9668|nr:DUF1822 family protein [Scytonema sp. UIC 10036]MUG96976.1 DUF1822 family protein [Scytonema sp. UIC 10036]